MDRKLPAPVILPQRNFRKVLWATTLLLTIFIIVPLAVFLWKFSKEPLSGDSSKWGVFGDYFGGVVGTLFSLVTAILALMAIYMSLRVAQSAQESERQHHLAALARETERFEAETALLEKQYKPFPYLDLQRGSSTKVTLCNYGLGPLNVTKIYVTHSSGSLHSNLAKALEDMLQQAYTRTFVAYNSAPTHILGAGSEKELLSISLDSNYTPAFGDFHRRCVEVLKECKVHIEYSDIFDKKGKTEFSLIFLAG